MDEGSFKSEITMINYNGKLSSSNSVTSVLQNRGFQYGDGIFETIIINTGQMKFEIEHWERITEGVEALRMEMPLTAEQFAQMQLNLLSANHLLNQYARMKLYIWRKAGGLYTPTASKADFMITVEQTEKKLARKFYKVGVSRTVQLHRTYFSHLKTLSALPYVMAGIEKKERNLDELLILNTEGIIAEASASNICFFDSSKQTIYTPSLKSGCVNGVCRRYLFKNAKQYDYKIEEVMWKPEDLNTELFVFTINVAGINQILKIDDVEMKENQNMLKTFESIFDT